jgi:mRNA interferase MazF
MSTNPHPSRGDVVLVDYPFSSGGGFKRRPALVIQNDQDNARLISTVVAMVTSRTGRVHEPTQLLIDVSTLEGQLSGLRHNSAVACTNLFTIEKTLVRSRIGALSANQMAQIDVCLKVALKLP